VNPYSWIPNSNELKLMEPDSDSLLFLEQVMNYLISASEEERNKQSFISTFTWVKNYLISKLQDDEFDKKLLMRSYKEKLGLKFLHPRNHPKV